MKASELIAELQKAVAEHGDLPVCWESEGRTTPCSPPSFDDGVCYFEGESVTELKAVPRYMISDSSQ